MSLICNLDLAKLVTIKNSCLDQCVPLAAEATPKSATTVGNAGGCSCQPACSRRFLFRGCSCMDCDQSLPPDHDGMIEAQAHLLPATARHPVASLLQVEARLLKDRKPTNI
ncbi:hypothetical protein DITRI_Ditri13aG0099700 [Diplodiscus trichospermus]